MRSKSILISLLIAVYTICVSSQDFQDDSDSFQVVFPSDTKVTGFLDDEIRLTANVAGIRKVGIQVSSSFNCFVPPQENVEKCNVSRESCLIQPNKEGQNVLFVCEIKAGSALGSHTITVTVWNASKENGKTETYNVLVDVAPRVQQLKLNNRVELITNQNSVSDILASTEYPPLIKPAPTDDLPICGPTIPICETLPPCPTSTSTCVNTPDVTLSTVHPPIPWTTTTTKSDDMGISPPRTTTTTKSDDMGISPPRTTTTTKSDDMGISPPVTTTPIKTTTTTTKSDDMGISPPRTTTTTKSDDMGISPPRTTTTATGFTISTLHAPIPWTTTTTTTTTTTATGFTISTLHAPIPWTPIPIPTTITLFPPGYTTTTTTVPEDEGPPTGLIVGAAIAGILGLAAAGGGAYYLAKTLKNRDGGGGLDSPAPAEAMDSWHGEDERGDWPDDSEGNSLNPDDLDALNAVEDGGAFWNENEIDLEYERALGV